MTPHGSVLMPYYLAIDESTDAAPYAMALTAGLRRLRRQILAEPLIDEIVRISVLTVHGDRCDGRAFARAAEFTVPQFAMCAGGLGLGALFRRVQSGIDAELLRLRASKARIYRPILFVLAVGRPNNAWEDELLALTSIPRRPVLVLIALGAESEEVLVALNQLDDRSIRYSQSRYAPDDAVRGGLEIVWQILSNSARTVTDGRPRHVMPRTSEDAPVSKERKPGNEITRASRYIQIDCTTTGRSTIGVLVFDGDGTWNLVRSVQHLGGRDMLASGSAVNGRFGIGRAFEGCARCGNGSYAKCTCGQLGCWDGSSWHTCQRCGRRQPITHVITDVSAAD